MAIATNWVPGSSLLRPRREADRARPVGRGPGQGLPRWWREATAAVGLYAVYSASRGLKQGDLASSDRTGQALLDWEQSWHLDPEHALNQLLFHLPALAVAASYFYAVLHYVVTPAVLVWMYRRRPDHYRTARTTLVVATVLGLVGFWFLPTTPPRLLAGSGFHDTLADVSAWGWWGGQASAPRGLGALTNQYAAMPSLHVGWALWSGWLIARHARGRAARAAGVLYPVLTALVVMSTGNHYLLDAAGGVADMALAAGIVVLLGWAIRTVRARHPLVRASETVMTEPSATPAGAGSSQHPLAGQAGAGVGTPSLARDPVVDIRDIDIRDLDDGPDGGWDVDDVGGKAASLQRARAAGLPVLPGFVVTTATAAAVADPDHHGHATASSALASAVDRLAGRLRPGTSLVVRSSSPVEDGAVSSQAGRFRSILDVAPDDVPAALASVVDSAAGAPMAVLVQPQLQARAGGVLFGVDPVGTYPGALILAAVPDTPADLVSGLVDGVTVPLSRRGRALGPHPEWLPSDLLRSLAGLARATARLFGGPQDMEWALDHAGTLRLLQSRPVTAAPGQLRPARGAHVLGAGPVAETFPEPLAPLEQDLWVPPLAEGISTALHVTGAASRRRLARTPPVVIVADRAVADLELLGTARRRRVWSLLDPRVGARRLVASWRVGRLRVALPQLAAETIAGLDRRLAEVPPPGELDDQQLLVALERSRRALATAHGYEILVGAIYPSDLSAASGAAGSPGWTPGGVAGAALRVLAAQSEISAAAATADPSGSRRDARLIADHPVLLALSPPSIPPRAVLPPMRTSAQADDQRRPPYPVSLPDRDDTDDPRPGAGDPQVLREALRLRARWLQELTAAIATELGRRLVGRGVLDDPAAVAGLRLDELPGAMAGTWSPSTPTQRTEQSAGPSQPAAGTTLPAAFKLSADGRVIPARLDAGRGDGTHATGVHGVPAGGGVGAGTVYHGDTPEIGTVLVVDALEPRLAVLLPGLAGLVSATGSPLSHLAILARELGVPTVVGVPDARQVLLAGTHVVVDGTSGRVDVVPDSPVGLGADLPEPVRERPSTDTQAQPAPEGNQS